MSWSSLPPNVKKVAERELSHKQLFAWKMQLDGYSVADIAHQLDVTEETTRDRLKLVRKQLRRHGVVQDKSGRWHILTPPERPSDAEATR